MIPAMQTENVPNAKEKRFDKAAFLCDPFAPDFTEVRQALLTHLRARQEATSCVSENTPPDSDLQKQSGISEQPVLQTIGDQPSSSPLKTNDQLIHPGCRQFNEIADNEISDDEQEALLGMPGHLNRSRLLDIVGVGLLSIPALVVIPVIALAIRITSGGPVFSRIRRLGQGERPFVLYRFRTTWVTLEPDQSYGAHLDDVAVTPLGVLLRNTKIERLPEIINIIKGDMSLVGPRARHPWFAGFMTPQQRLHIFSARPGLVGPVQLRFRYERRLMACQPDKLGYFLRVLMPIQLRIEEEYLRQRTMHRDLGLIAWMWRVTWRNFGSRNRQVLRDWLDQGGQTEALVGRTLPSDQAVRDFYPQNSACMYTRRWERFATKSGR